jgi:tetratricopeptide (TPR) repeat protein
MRAPCERDLSAALALHQQGRLEEAEDRYGRVVERDPRNADGWHLLGRIGLQQGRLAEASARVLKAIRQRPQTAAFHTTLGEILAAQGRHSDAALCYREALRLQPDWLPALVNLGNALAAQKLYRQACGAFLRAIQRDPCCAQAFNNLGNALRAQGSHPEALDCFREALRLSPADAEPAVNLSAAFLQVENCREAERWARHALRLRPGMAEGLSNLAVALLHQGRDGEAEQAVREALAASPQAAHLHSNLGSVLLRQKRFAAAEEACRRALELQPGSAESANNLGVALQGMDRLEEAAAQFAGAARARPDYPEAWTNLGTVRQAQNRPADALACFEEALRQNPRFAKAHFCRSFTLMQEGRFAAGFAEYEWRWKIVGEPPRALARPRWEGGPLQGKTILLFAEQGLGDTLQFARYATLVAARGGRVLVECQPKVASLVRSIEGVAETITPADALPDFDVQAPLMSLPGIFGTTPGTVPATVPYLKVPPALTARLRARLAPGPRRVGLAWAGNPAHASDRQRSVALRALAPLAALPGIQWYSLQAGAGVASEIGAAGGWLRQALDESEGVPELAALVKSLDLVITVDTMPAHLAGALGRPVWNLLAWAPDWRWFAAGDTSPWYPSMRLFRQGQAGDWHGVVESVAEALRSDTVQASPGSVDMQQ